MVFLFWRAAALSSTRSKEFARACLRFASRKTLVLACGIVALMAASCVRTPEPAMRIGTDVWPGYEPLFLARHEGLLEDGEFRLVEFSNSSAVGRGFRNDTLEAACLTMDEVFYLVENGRKPVILLVLDESHGADALLARPEIKSLADLKGKRIAVEISAVETYTLTRALQHANLTVNDVTPVYLPMDKHIAAYESGEVDAVVTFEPTRSRLLAAGAKDLFNSSMIPGEIVDVLVVRRDYLEKYPERARALRKAWFAALAKMKASPEESARVMGVREQVGASAFQESLGGLHFPSEQENRAMLGGEHPGLMASAERLKQVMLDAKLLEQDISLKSLFDLPESCTEHATE